jgi:Putative intracellular protease/amidase
MFTIYVYVPDTMADWEAGYVTSELHSGRFFKKDAPQVLLKTVGASKSPVHTMGGLTVVPDCLADDITAAGTSVLLLPGANTWNEARHDAILKKAEEFLSAGAVVGAICGATAALAGRGLLDRRPHTSNGPGFLEMFAPGYKGQCFYIDQPSVADENLITAGSTGGLLWARQIIERLSVFRADTLEAWYAYFSTGKPEHFCALMQTLPASNLAPQQAAK